MDKKAEIIATENILKLLRRGKWELEGDEILAFYRSFEFLVKKLNELKQPDIKVASVDPIKSPQDSTKKLRKKKNE